MNTEQLRSLVEGQGLAFRGATRAAGGDINQACRIDTDQGRLFLKYRSDAPSGMFEAEARGLEALAEAAVPDLRIPAVMAFGSGYLLLEYLELGARGSLVDERLGSALAALHRVRQPTFGWTIDNYLGTTPQPNPQADDWVEFFTRHRLLNQVERLARKGSADLLEPARRLAGRLPAWFADYAPHPALVHGDLWSGNAASTGEGWPVIYDPAVYWGDRETDLAMMELFGGFTKACFDAYSESLPLDPGYPDRRPLYQLYHILNHANLFGGGYVQRSLALLNRLASEPG
ncbi:MAG: fructosamine kinase family protein [Xanthomonadales bacterium]|nr:fructosamine kinase family protein [Xanthomonadales bacterium]